MVDFTGYWTFFCNPRRWNIDDFLNSGQVYDTFTISDYHKNEFKKGQLGVVRVGHDRRTIAQLDGKERLERGIYAVVEVLGEAELMEEKVSDYIIDEDLTEERYRVNIKYIKNLINNIKTNEHLTSLKTYKINPQKLPATFIKYQIPNKSSALNL